MWFEVHFRGHGRPPAVARFNERLLSTVWGCSAVRKPYLTQMQNDEDDSDARLPEVRPVDEQQLMEAFLVAQELLGSGSGPAVIAEDDTERVLKDICEELKVSQATAIDLFRRTCALLSYLSDPAHRVGHDAGGEATDADAAIWSAAARARVVTEDEGDVIQDNFDPSEFEQLVKGASA
jgi:hypothetical protein